MGTRPKLIDLTGQRFGKLTALEKVGNNRKGEALWKCRCECGGETTTLSRNLRTGGATSCGCSRRRVI